MCRLYQGAQMCGPQWFGFVGFVIMQMFIRSGQNFKRPWVQVVLTVLYRENTSPISSVYSEITDTDSECIT